MKVIACIVVISAAVCFADDPNIWFNPTNGVAYKVVSNKLVRLATSDVVAELNKLKVKK